MALGGQEDRSTVIAGEQTSSFVRFLHLFIRSAGRAWSQPRFLLKQTSLRKSLYLMEYAETMPAGSKNEATVDRTSALVQLKVIIIICIFPYYLCDPNSCATA